MADSDRISLMLDSMIRAVEEGFSYDGIVSVPETGLEDIEHRSGLVGLLHDGLDLVRKAAGVFKKPDLKRVKSPRSQDQEPKADPNPRDSGISESKNPKLSPLTHNPPLDAQSEKDLPDVWADDGSPQASLVGEEPSGDNQPAGIVNEGPSDKGYTGKQPRKKREEEGPSTSDNAARQPRKKREEVKSPDDTRNLPRKKRDDSEHSTVNTDMERQPRKKHGKWNGGRYHSVGRDTNLG